MVETADPIRMNSPFVEMLPVDAAPEPEIDFESIDREMGRMMIYIFRDRSNNYFMLSESAGREWMAQVKENAGQYSWRKWNITAFPVAKISLDVLQVSVIAFSGANMKKIEPILKTVGFVQSTVDTAKQFFDTLDQGVRTEGQAKAELSKLLFERNEREAQSSEQQTAENHRKAEESRRRREDIEQAMARA